MYINYPTWSGPNRDIKIWKYMDFWKFDYLLNRKCLFFSRIDDFDDFFEGRSSKDLHKLFKMYKERTYANCWHQNDYESNLMWKVYSKDSEGIAIQSSFNRLCRCFRDSKIDQYISKVAYDNSDLKPETNTLIPFFRKRKEFKSEKEIRAIVQIMDIKENNPEKGIHINVNLTDLIENIYTSPYSSHDFITKVKKLGSKHNLEKSIKKSELLYQHTNNIENQALEIIIEPNLQSETDASGNITKRNNLIHIRGQKKARS